MISQAMTRGRALLLAASLLALPAAALAQDAVTANPAGGTPLGGTGTFMAFHEKAGIDRIVDDFVGRVTTDPRIEVYFKTANLDNLRMKLKEQFCYLLDGGCTYEGRDMTSVHAGMNLQNRDFNALAEDLEKAMDKEGVPYAAQDRLLAKLAPMQKVIVTRQ
jgi:hemoglobin